MKNESQPIYTSKCSMFVKLWTVVFIVVIMLVIPDMKVHAEGEQVVLSGTGELTQEYVKSHLGDATEVVISGFSRIGNYAFQDKSEITNVIIQDSVVSIGGWAFQDCSSLTSITIPESVTSIGNVAFGDCSSLTSVTIPESVTSIGNVAFGGCSSLTSVTIPDSVTAIGSRVFSGCSSLTSVTIPNSVSEMGDDVFSDCPGLITAGPIGGGYNIEFGWTDMIIESAFHGSNYLTTVTIPDGITTIDKGAFQECSYLSKVTIPDSVTTIGSSVFWECSSLRDIVIPDSVTYLGGFAFLGCSSLKAITIPKGVTAIGENTFSQCSSLANVTLPNSVASIGGSAFSYCSSLLSMTIPSGVTSIENQAFDECRNLHTITIPYTVTKMSFWIFSGCNDLTIQGYSGSTAEQYANDNDIPFVSIGTCGTVSFDDSEAGGHISDDVAKKNGHVYVADEPYAWFPNVATDSGYAFLGWYLEKEGNHKVSEKDIFYGGNITLYAKWAKTDAYFMEGNDGKFYWYENGIKQGTYDDPKGVLGDGTVRGREIYDPASDGWYWLDSKYDGAKACNKEVWMPYIYQNEASWDDAEIEMNANNSGSMKQQVINFIKNRYGKWVRYDANGKMYKGWYTVEGTDAYIYPEQIGNTYYYDYQTGLMAKGWQNIDGKDYYFDEQTGVLVK